jgi:ParB family chromosome partitioning protein
MTELPQAGSADSDERVVYKHTDQIIPGRYQPRRVFPQESLAELAESIRENGVIQPLIVRPLQDGKYEIVAGERRWRAAQKAGFDAVPVIVKNLSDSESLETALVENLQREDLNPLDAAEAYDTLIKNFSYTHELLAKRVGKDRSNITNHLRLLKLPDPIKDDLREARLSMGHARTLLGVESLAAQMTLSRRTIKHNLSVRDLEKIVNNYKKKKPSDAPGAVKEKDDDCVRLERALAGHFSSKVLIKANSNGSGKIEIHFHSKEELDRLVEAIGFSEDFA